MHLSDDEQPIHDPIDAKSDSSCITSQEADQSMASSEPAADLNFANLTSSAVNDDDDDASGYEAIADTEVSIKLDSPLRNSSVAFTTVRDRRASVTVNTQEALNDVYIMYGKPAKSSDDSDDNFDNSDAGDDDRLFDENTAFTAAGVRDATADVTFWSQPVSKSSSNVDPQTQYENSAPIQDENALACRQPLHGVPESLQSDRPRGISAFKPIRKPLAPVIPFPDENDLSTPAVGPAGPSRPPFPSGSKRIPLAVKATHPQQHQNHHESPNNAELDRQLPPTPNLQWQSNHQMNPLSNQYSTPNIHQDVSLFPPPETLTSEEEGGYDNRFGDEDIMYDDDTDQGRLIPRPLRFIPTGDNFNALTPITERTSECPSLTGSHYINRTREIQSSAHQKMTRDLSEMELDDGDSDATPQANHFCDENARKNSFYHSHPSSQSHLSVHQLLEPYAVDHPHSLLHQSRGHGLMETPSKILHQTRADRTSLPHPYAHSEAGDLTMSSPSRIPPSPTTFQAGEPCNPFAPDIVNILLEELGLRSNAYPGFQSLMDRQADKLQQLRRRCKTRNRKNSHSSVTAEEALWEVTLGDDVYFIYEKLGEGAYGSVFRISEAADEDSTAIYEDNSIQKAMKVENPPNLYEFFILSQLHRTLPGRLRQSIVNPQRLYAYADESFLIMDYSDQGTLLDIVNRAADIGIKPTAPGICRGVDELVAIFFTIELMRVVEGLHEAGYIHGDLKIDNCMVRLQSPPGGNKSWSSDYDPEGHDGWSYKGLMLIDYGRSIDTSVFPPSQQFIAEWQTDEYDCMEMRTGQPWTFQPDYHGIIGVAHCLLFGSFMTEKDSLKPAFKRYHQISLWNELFDACLRPREIPNTQDLRSVRISMEQWLKQNCERHGKSLKGFLKKIEVASLCSYH